MNIVVKRKHGIYDEAPVRAARHTVVKVVVGVADIRQREGRDAFAAHTLLVAEHHLLAGLVDEVAVVICRYTYAVVQRILHVVSPDKIQEVAGVHIIVVRTDDTCVDEVDLAADTLDTTVVAVTPLPHTHHYHHEPDDSQQGQKYTPLKTNMSL